MKQLLLIGLFTFGAISTTSANCLCYGVIDGFPTYIIYSAANDDCGNPDAIDWTSGSATVEFTPGKYTQLGGADPGACLN